MIVPTLLLAAVLFGSVWALAVAYRYAVALLDRIRLRNKGREA